MVQADYIVSEPIDQVVDQRTFIKNGMGKYNLLKPEEEHALAVRVKEHDCIESRNTLIEKFMPLVYSEAIRLYHPNADNVVFEDLFQEGILGFMSALKRFDPSKGVRLSTYAITQIKYNMLQLKRDSEGPCRLFTTKGASALYSKWTLVRTDIENGMSLDDVSIKYNVPLRDVMHVLCVRTANISIPVGVDGCGVHRYGDDDSVDPDVEAVATDDDPCRSLLIAQARLIDTSISNFMSTLDARDLDILENRILADEPQRMRVLAEKHGITVARVDQLEKKIKQRLKTQFDRDGITMDHVEWY